ncbi:hypothetical protein [Bacillus sp. Hm123]|uniref:hypothetical protein n=1 Tax=Bacillus sp. Hm123 TaxID=3450745 RepID=UPI003F437D80
MKVLTQDQIKLVAEVIQEKREDFDLFQYLTDASLSANIKMSKEEYEAYQAGLIRGYLASVEITKFIISNQRLKAATV